MMQQVLHSIIQDCNFNQDQTGIDRYEIIVLIRRCIIGLSSLALFANLVWIIIKKQHGSPLIRYFAAVQFFYLVALLSALFHHKELSLGVFKRGDQNDFMKILSECMISKNNNVEIAIQGFVNLSCYSISYWFAIHMAIYIRSRISKTQPPVIKKIVAGFIFILIWYVVPLVLTFIKDACFSIGPIGYRVTGSQDTYYFFYAGIINRIQIQADYYVLVQALTLIWKLLIPVSCATYHLHLICQKQDDEVMKQPFRMYSEPQQVFCKQSAWISYFLFFVQIYNFAKYLLMVLDLVSILVFILNILYDFFGLILPVLYYKYYRNMAAPISQQNRTTLIGSQDQVQ